RAELVDAVLEAGALLVEGADLRTLLRFGFGDDAGGGGMAFRDQRVALLDAFLDVLLVQPACQLQEVVGAVRVGGTGVGRGGVRRRGRLNRGRGRCGLLGSREAALELFVLLLEPGDLTVVRSRGG